MTTRDTTTRRQWLTGAAVVLATPMAADLVPGLARAAAKTPKTAVDYQYTPKGDQHCGACASFIPGETTQGPGTCRIVDGPIQQNGWCALFSRR